MLFIVGLIHRSVHVYRHLNWDLYRHFYLFFYHSIDIDRFINVYRFLYVLRNLYSLNHLPRNFSNHLFNYLYRDSLLDLYVFWDLYNLLYYSLWSWNISRDLHLHLYYLLDWNMFDYLYSFLYDFLYELRGFRFLEG
jgi:hypothetical protein